MSDEFDGSMTLRSPGLEPIRQFVIYAENKVGWLNDFLLMLDEGGIHILAISVLDASDSAVIGLVRTIRKDLARLLKSRSISFTERIILAIESRSGRFDAKNYKISFRREINIHYVYPFLHQPNGKPSTAIAMEDQETAKDALSSYHFESFNT